MTDSWGHLELAPIGNCAASMLVDRQGRFVWGCLPRVDGEPVFGALLGGEDPAEAGTAGLWAIDVENFARAEQSYERNTAILRTRLWDASGAGIEIIDFCPRYKRHNRVYRPLAFCRLITPLEGSARIRVRLSAQEGWNGLTAQRTWGSNHIRYLATPAALRLTTTLPVSHIINERFFRLEERHVLFLGPDEPFDGDLRSSSLAMYENTRGYWQEWVRSLATPLEWQAQVIRAAIALKLCVYEETGAIVAAMTTSIPESPDSGRNWDYRFCWLRDAYYTIQALNRLGAADVLEGYLAYLRNIVDIAPGGDVRPLYGVGMESILDERIVESFPGYRRMGPVRVGNQAHLQDQHDVYGQIILSNVQAFFDTRLLRQPNVEDFHSLEKIGERAYQLYLTPDAGLWEFRSRTHPHTYSAVMSWAGCDRLANTAKHLSLPDREALWRGRADEIRQAIMARAWNAKTQRFAATLGGNEMDASLLQMLDTRFISPSDPRFLSTFAAIEKELLRDSHVLRYALEDDFGVPQAGFNICTFWYIEALFLLGRREEARKLFVQMLERCTPAGLLSEHCDIATGAAWGNYPQTYSLVGLINCAILLSNPWSDVR